MPVVRYFFELHERLQFGFATPNYLGAFLCMLLSFCWCLTLDRARGAWLRRISWGIVEIPLIGLLVMTYSRGAFLACLVALAFFGLLGRHRLPVAERFSFLIQVSLRLLLLFGFAIGSEFWKRSTLEYLAHDASVLNRLEVWKGALVLMSLRPWSGWGWGTSGMLYVNWIQDSGPDSYLGVVNTYLQLGCELGILVPVALGTTIIWLILCLVQTSSIAASARIPWENGLGCSVIAWSIANVFSTLGESLTLNLTAFASFVGCWLIVLWQKGWIFDIGMWLRGVLAVSITTIMAILCLAGGIYINSNRPLRLEQVEIDAIVLHRETDGPSVDLYPDVQVLGPFYGRHIRALMAETNFSSVRVLQRIPDRLAHSAIFFGRQWIRNQHACYPNAIYFSPRDLVRNTSAEGVSAVYLLHGSRELDTIAWRLWACNAGIPIREITEEGLLLTSATWRTIAP